MTRLLIEYSSGKIEKPESPAAMATNFERKLDMIEAGRSWLAGSSTSSAVVAVPTTCKPAANSAS
jgi:hypothetical protein